MNENAFASRRVRIHPCTSTASKAVALWSASLTEMGLSMSHGTPSRRPRKEKGAPECFPSAQNPSGSRPPPLDSLFRPALFPMKTRLCTVLLLVTTLVPSFVSPQTQLPTKKVVFTSTGPARLSEGEIAELRQLAPSLNIVFPARDKMDAEIVDADAVIGTITPEQ